MPRFGLRYWRGTFGRRQRGLILLAALVLLPVFFLPVLPIWHLRMVAPQYREGLELHIYTNSIAGDVDKINILNHYVGMKAIAAEDFREFRYMPQLLTFLGVMALVAALLGRRWIAVLGWLGFTAFAVVMFTDYILWLYRYGHELDPRAAIRLETFMPPVIGYQRMANFKVWSYPGVGTWLLAAAWLLGPVALGLERRKARKTRRTPAPRDRRMAALGLAAGLLLAGATEPLGAAEHRVAAGPGGAQQALDGAAAGDTVHLGPGTHPGPLRIPRAITLRGDPGAVVDGGGRGTVVTVAAGGARIEDLEIRGSGRRVLTVDAGLHVLRAADVAVQRIRMRDVLYGIYAERADRLRVSGSDLAGRVTTLDGAGEGNGIHLWYSEGASIRSSRITSFLDGIYLSFAHEAAVEGNDLADHGRYGLHTMYCQSNRLVENRFTRNAAGIAVMFSNRLSVEGNAIVHNRGPRTYGLLLRDCSDGVFLGNQLVDNTVALFLDGSNRNRFAGNLVQDNGWGVLLFSSSADNVWTRNDFLHNDYPVALDMRRTRNRFDDGERGNYWSEAETYDLDGDGVGDVPFGPVTAFAFLSKQYPDLSVLAKSPAVAALGVAERVFPTLRPSDAVDRFPLTRPAGGRARRDRAAQRPPGPAWGALVAFAAMWGAGLAGLGRSLRRFG
jgi:nitrous oxidase accessory protein